MFTPLTSDTPISTTHHRSVLRLGLVHGDRLIDDRAWSGPHRITVGMNLRDSVVLPPDDYQGPSIGFVQHRDGTVTMRVPAGMRVRIALGSQPTDIEDLRAEGGAWPDGDGLVCHLAPGARGRAVMGQHNLLFQIVRQTVTVPVLPRRSLVQRAVSGVLCDPAWWVSLAVTALCVGGTAAQAHAFAGRVAPTLAVSPVETPEQVEYAVELPEVRELPPLVPQEAGQANAAPDKPVEAAARAPRAASTKTSDAALGRTARAAKDASQAEGARNPRADVDQRLREKSIAGVFPENPTTKIFAETEGPADHQASRSLFGPATSRDAESSGPGRAVAAYGGLKVAASSIALARPGVISGGERDSALNLAGPQKREGPRVDVGNLQGQPDSATDDTTGVKRLVVRADTRVQRCYEKALRDNPEMSGKVSVTFVVGTEGTVTSATVAGASGSFARCLEDMFMAIRGLPALTMAQTFVQSYVFSKGQ